MSFVHEYSERFGLATLSWEGRACAAIQVAESYWPLAPTGFDGSGEIGVKELLESWEESFPKLSRHARACVMGEVPSECVVPARQAKVLSPLRYPNKVIGVASNYRSQCREMGLPPEPWRPLPLFVRPATNTIVGPHEPMHMPCGDGLDWEIEIGAVMGRRMRNVPASQALLGVAAYVVAVDLTVRDLLIVETPFKIDLFRSKCQDGLLPLGPSLIPAAFVPDPHNLRLQLSINGVIKQDESSSDMLVPIDELISEVSRYVTWEPGDLLLTGTPAGTSGRSGQFLKPGDHVRAAIERLGVLQFEILPRVA